MKKILVVSFLTSIAFAQDPKPLMPGGVVLTLFPPGSPYLKAARVHEAEQYNMSTTVPGRIDSIVNIHNPSIEFHPASKGANTGATVILVAGGGHNTLNVGGEAIDFVTFFYNYGVNSVILRSRLRRDGYDPLTDERYDAMQAIKLTRAHAKEWNLDPNKIGIMGFSAGAELASAAAVLFGDFDAKEGGATSRPDFVGLIYPGPTPFAKGRTAPPIPRNVPPTFITCAGSGDKVHAVWADEYFAAMLALSVPNLEMHIYGTGGHGGGMTDRHGTPFGTWQVRFIDWFRELGFLDKPGVETKAAKDIATFLNPPPAPAK